MQTKVSKLDRSTCSYNSWY